MGQWASSSAPRPAATRNDTGDALRAVFGGRFDGVADIRLLLVRDRVAGTRHKVFFVLNTHDVARDFEIVSLMNQFDSLDYDLVPVEAAGMVPDGARSIV